MRILSDMLEKNEPHRAVWEDVKKLLFRRQEVNNMLTNWWDRQNAAPLKFDPLPSEAAFSTVFRTSINADWK